MCFVMCKIQLFKQAKKNATSIWYTLEQVVGQTDLNILKLLEHT